MIIFGWVTSVDEPMFSITDSYKVSHFKNPQETFSEEEKLILKPWNYIAVETPADAENVEKDALPATRYWIISEDKLGLDPVAFDREAALLYPYLHSRISGKNEVLKLKDKLIRHSLNFFWERDFQFIETPALTRSISEYSNEEFTVSAKLLNNKTFSLSQSPQLFKQLLIAGGIKKYFQLSRNFRAEMGSPVHFQEFNQVDVEIAHPSREMMMNVMEEYLLHIFSSLKGMMLPHPFPVFTYNEITGRYNSESPNLLLDETLREKYPGYFEIGLFPYFIIDFPLAVSSETGRPAPVRHLMARLRDGDESITNPLQQYTTGYDLVINGVEIGGGDLRNNSFELQMQIFKSLGLDEKEIDQVYSTLLTALKSAVPPHGGFAIGIDRLALALTSLPNIMDVVPFPKTHECICKLTASPS